MAYENIGTPTGNNLYITIPLRGTDNWDEKLKDGFFQRVVDHDHTPGKGAAIQEAALDNALQTKVAAIATNTSEIAQNALDISQNAAAILANATNINSNDTDIAALDTRLTTAESNITSNDTDIAALDTRLTTAESDKITATEAQNLIDAGGFTTATETQVLINNSLTNYSDTAGVQALISSTNIETLSNVDNLTPSDGDVLVYNTNFSRWIPAAPSTGGSGNLKVLVADDPLVAITAAFTEFEVFENYPLYDPSNLINSSNEFIAPSDGVYLVNVSGLFDSGSTQSWIKIYVGGTFLEFHYDQDGGSVNTGDAPFNVTAGTAIRATVRTNSGINHTISCNYTIKQIL